MLTESGKLPRARWRRFARTNVVQLSLVVGNAIAHAVLGWLGVYWFECSWWPWLVTPLCALTGALTLQTCLPDRHVGDFARVLREALMVYTSTLILATPLIALSVLPLAFGAELLGPFGRRALVLSSYAAALSLSLWAVVVCRRWVRVTETTVALADLPRALEGYTIAHLSDLHVGSTDSKQVAKSWAALTNRYQPDLIAITGADTAEGEVYVTAYHRLHDGKGGFNDLLEGLRYLDQYRKTDGRWQFVRRTLVNDWAQVGPSYWDLEDPALKGTPVGRADPDDRRGRRRAHDLERQGGARRRIENHPRAAGRCVRRRPPRARRSDP